MFTDREREAIKLRMYIERCHIDVGFWEEEIQLLEARIREAQDKANRQKSRLGYLEAIGVIDSLKDKGVV